MGKAVELRNPMAVVVEEGEDIIGFRAGENFSHHKMVLEVEF